MFIVSRIYVRLRFLRNLFVDDAFVIVAWLMTVVTAAIWQKVAKDLYFAVLVGAGHIHVPPAEFRARLRSCLHAILATYLLFYSTLWSIKLSFLFFFRRLGQNVRRQKTIWWIVFTITILSYLVCVAILDYNCLTGGDGISSCTSVIGSMLTSSSTLFEPACSSLSILHCTSCYRARHYNGCLQ